MKVAVAVGVTMALLFAGGCSGTEDETEVGTSDVDEGIAQAPQEEEGGGEAGTWTVLLYSMADTDLEPFMMDDVAEAADVGSGDGLEIVALVDRSADYYEGEVVDQPDWESTKLFRVAPGSLEEIEDLGEANLADPATLASFIERGVTEYPADHYALILSDHGGGWTGLGPDETDGSTVLDLAGVEAGLRTGLEAAGIDRLDLLGFDACLMATYEVARALQDHTDYLLASQELEPGHGWDYRRLEVAAGGGTDALGLGRELLDGFRAQAEEAETEADITLSLVDMAQMPALDAAVDAFANALVEQSAILAPIVGRERAEVLEFGRSADPASSTHLADLGLFVSEVGTQSLQVSDQADAVIRALGDAVVERTSGALTEGATGLSIYFPTAADYSDAAYNTTVQLSSWQGFLGAYHGAGQAIPVEAQPVIADPESGLAVELTDEGADVATQIGAAGVGNVADATLYYGYVNPDDGAVVLLGDDEAAVAEDGTVTGFTDLTEFTITDGEDTISAYLSLSTDEEAGLGTADVPLIYYPPGDEEGQDVVLSIVFDLETGDVTQEQYFQVDESGNWGQLFAEDDGLLEAVVQVFPADGSEPVWEPYGESLVYARLADLGYDVTPLPAGTEVYVDLTITDFGDNEAVSSATVVLE